MVMMMIIILIAEYQQESFEKYKDNSIFFFIASLSFCFTKASDIGSMGLKSYVRVPKKLCLRLRDIPVLQAPWYLLLRTHRELCISAVSQALRASGEAYTL